MKETFYILVISMWGHTGVEWVYIGNQIALQQPMTESQCFFLKSEDMWQASYENEYYKLQADCFDADCSGKKECK